MSVSWLESQKESQSILRDFLRFNSLCNTCYDIYGDLKQCTSQANLNSLCCGNIFHLTFACLGITYILLNWLLFACRWDVCQEH